MAGPREPIFNAVRAAARPGLFNDPGNVHALDQMLDAFGVPRDDARRTTGPAGIKLIQEFEGCKLTAYPDPGTGGAPWTIGWGATTDLDGRLIKPGTVWTQQQADYRFLKHLRTFEDDLNKLLGNAPTTQNQFDALVSLLYNIGPANFAASTLLRRHKAGNYASAADEFPKWNRAGGKVLKGLVRRRAAEAALYRS